MGETESVKDEKKDGEEEGEERVGVMEGRRRARGWERSGKEEAEGC